MAINNGKCVYEVEFEVPERPSEMYTIIDIESGKIVLQQDILLSFSKAHLFNYKNDILEDSVSEIQDLNRKERGNMALTVKIIIHFINDLYNNSS